MLPSSEPIALRLVGASLETAREIHELSKEANAEYTELKKELSLFEEQLFAQYDRKYSIEFTELMHRLADEVGIPEDQITSYHLDASYLDDHDIAFLKLGEG